MEFELYNLFVLVHISSSPLMLRLMFLQALRLEAAWRAECVTTKLNSYNPRYQAAYEEFILQKSQTSDYSGFFRAKQPYYAALSLAHNLMTLNMYPRVEAWGMQSIDFLDSSYQPQTVVAQMHALAVMLVNGQKKICSKEKLGCLVFEALKACVGCLVSYLRHILSMSIYVVRENSGNDKHANALQQQHPSVLYLPCFHKEKQ